MAGGSMQSDQYFAEMLEMMRAQGRKDNPVTLLLGVMQSNNSVKINDLVLNAEDLYIADYLVADYTRKIEVPYISDVSYANSDVRVNKQDHITLMSAFKKGDLVAVQRLHNTNKYVILAKVVEA